MSPSITEILKEEKTGVGRTIRLCNLLMLWPKVAGEKISCKTEAVKISNRCLHINAFSAAWANELSFLKDEFVQKFNGLAEEEVIQDIKFKVGGN